MFETLKNAWKLPDLKRRICFTLMIIVIFRFGAALPVPFLDASVMQGFGDGNLLGFLNMLAGGAYQNAALCALSNSRTSPPALLYSGWGLQFRLWNRWPKKALRAERD